jgi:EAL domain-containing protein (putative c-di-GMP-specific phosphodiesterase class I)
MSLESVALAFSGPQLVGARFAEQAVSAGRADCSFSRALRSLSLVYQPIVRFSDRRVVAHEALVRSAEPGLERPGPLFARARELGRERELGRGIRERLVSDLEHEPSQVEGDVFANLDAGDLTDAQLFDAHAPLARFSDRLVLEITERASLETIPDIRGRVASLRELGFRIAVDDLGAGYAGLSSLAVLEPEVVKLDMSLIRRVDVEPTRRHVIRSLARLCAKLRCLVVAEGVETTRERDALLTVGCDVFQGHLFALPARRPPRVCW